jgi:hypothetical protein
MKVNKILTSLLVAMLLIGPVIAAYDTPTQTHNGNAMWIEDQFGSSDIYYDTTNASIGTVFNVTMYVNTSLAKVAGWQFQMYFDGSWLQVDNCWWSGLTPAPNSRSQFFEKAGASNVAMLPTIGVGSLLFGEAWSAGNYPGALQDGSSVCYIEFEITALPSKGTPRHTVIDINDYATNGESDDTYFLYGGTYYRGIGINGTMTFAWAKPAMPKMGVMAPFTPYPPGEIFYNTTHHIGDTFDVPLYILGLDPAWTLANVSFNLNFDNSLIIPFAPKVTFDLAFTGYYDDSTPGTIYFFASPTGPVSGDVLVATVKFKIIAQNDYPAANLLSPLNFDNTTIYDVDYLIGTTTGPPILPAPVNGGVTVQAYIAAPFPYLAVDPSVTTFDSFPHLGEQFKVNVMVKRLSFVWYLVGLDFRLSYDPSLLAVVNITEGPYFPQYNQSNFIPTTIFVAYDFGDNVGVLDLILPDPGAVNADMLYPAPLPGGTTPPDYTDGGVGVIATIWFQVINQSQGCDPSPYSCGLNLYDMMMVDKHGGYITADTPQDGTYSIMGTGVGMGKYIDIFTEYPSPYGGQHLNTWSDMFWPQKLVCLYAYVAYNCWPLQQKLVTFTIFDNNGAVFTQLAVPTNASGYAEVCFRMPWPCDDPESWFGVWSARADVDIACTVVNDTVYWHYDYLINYLKVTTDKIPPEVYLHGGWVHATITFQSYARQIYHVAITATLLDNLSYPVSWRDTQLDIGGPQVQVCHYYNYSVTLCLYIPKYAAPIEATVYAVSRLWWDGRYSEEPVPDPAWVAAGPMASTKIWIDNTPPGPWP